MAWKFKKQDFQEDAVNAVCEIFEGQQKGIFKHQLGLSGKLDDFGYKNEQLTLSLDTILKRIREVQRKNKLHESKQLEGDGINLTIEMETGTGKTYAYVNTIYELNKRYGWSKFVIIVPSIAIREGVKNSLQLMQDNFAAIYGKKSTFFIFDASKPNQIEDFARSSSINIMIINSQSFNKKDFSEDSNSKTQNNMYKKTEYGRRLIDLISGTNPILIIDEPQSVEGKQTKKALNEFKPLFTLRYSATHREAYNMIYILDAIDAFNRKLVKKIRVKGIEIKGTTGTHSYMYLEGIDISQEDYPKARIEIEVKQKNSVVKKSLKFSQGDDLYSRSGNIQEYKGYKIAEIDGLQNTVRFTNEKIIKIGETHGNIDEKHKRRIQIRETIKSHINKEKILFEKGIKTISLFFIDEVARYRQYDSTGNQVDGEYAKMFLEEYDEILKREEIVFPEGYKEYLKKISPSETHKGYFSIDKKTKQLQDPKLTGRGNEKSSDDIYAYDLIMKDKERLLGLKEPTRFIFSHSALREGWDNPNVFQICVLRNTDPAEVRTRQEVGRGLRLCVNQEKERIDQDFEGIDFSETNILTIIANESYEDFARGLQKEFSKELRERPTELDERFLIKQKLGEKHIDELLARKILRALIKNDYLTEENTLSSKYHEDLEKGELDFGEELKEETDNLIKLLRDFSQGVPMPENEDEIKTMPNKLTDKFKDPELKKMWEFINSKTYYEVDFESELLIKNSITKINANLEVVKIHAEITQASTKDYLKRSDLEDNNLFVKEKIEDYSTENIISSSIVYDLVGEIVKETNLTRKTITTILEKIDSEKFEKYKENPEDFIIQMSKIINSQKAEIILDRIKYYKTGKKISLDIFKNNKFLNNRAFRIDDPKKYIYEFLEYDSDIEKKLAENLNTFKQLKVFAKLPKGEYNIETPVGKYSPDWLIVFDKKEITHAYFIAETKGTTEEINLKGVERAKIECAKKHFKAISGDKVKFDVTDSFEDLKKKIGMN
jgi:type III restriction enzyme